MLRPTHPELTTYNSLLPFASCPLAAVDCSWRLSAPGKCLHATHKSPHSACTAHTSFGITPVFSAIAALLFRILLQIPYKLFSISPVFSYLRTLYTKSGGWGGICRLWLTSALSQFGTRLHTACALLGSSLRTRRKREPPAPLVIPNPVARFWRTAVRDLLSATVGFPSVKSHGSRLLVHWRHRFP